MPSTRETAVQGDIAQWNCGATAIGAGTYGRLELNNAAGARLLNNISLAQDFLLTNGVLDINQFLLSLG